MKVLYFNTLYYPVEVGGAEKSLRNLILALRQLQGVTPVVVTLNDQSADDDTVSVVDGVQVYRMGYRNTRFIVGPRVGPVRRALWHLQEIDNKRFDAALNAIFDAEQPDLVHTNNLLGFSARPIYLAHQRQIPVVHTLRDYYFQCWKSCKFSDGRSCPTVCLSCAALSHQRKTYSDLASCVVGNSAFILHDHTDNGRFAQVPLQRVVYNIYEPDSVASPRPAPPAGRIRLGYMGRLNREKGICELIDTVQGVAGFELHIAGDGELAADVKAAASAHDNIVYLGYAEPQALVRDIDLLVVPSLWNEPLSRTIFEAYSYGVPVIGSRCGGTPEIIEEGVTGATFDTADFAAVRTLARQICETPGVYERMSADCLAYAGRFSRQAISAAYHAIYQEVLQGARSSRA